MKYYVIKHLTILKVRGMMDINANLLQWFIDIYIIFFDKKTCRRAIKIEIMSNKKLAGE